MMANRLIIAAVLALSSPAVVVVADDGGSSGSGEIGAGKEAGASREKEFRKAFLDSMRSIFPFDEEEIREAKRKAREQGRQIYSEKPPQAVTATVQASLDPGTSPTIVRIAPGYVTAIEVLDGTGAPWPIEFSSIGNPGAYSLIVPDGAKPGNLVTVSALTRYGHTNLILKLKDHSTPLVVDLRTDEKVSQQLVSIRIDRDGPEAIAPVVGPPPARSVPDEIQAFIDGVPPKSASRVDLEGEPPGVALWSYGGSYYLRLGGEMALYWPAWDQVASGSGGVRVYRIPVVDAVRLGSGGDGDRLYQVKDNG